MDEVDETAFLTECRRRAEGAEEKPALIARRLVDELLERDEDDPLLQSMMCWLVERAPAIVAKEMNRWTSRSPRKAPEVKVERFRHAVRSGDVDALADFGLVYVVDGTEKLLGDMTGDDHRKVAQGFQSIAEQSSLVAAFHREMAKVVGSRRTADVVNEQQYRQLITRLTPALGLPA